LCSRKGIISHGHVIFWMLRGVDSDVVDALHLTQVNMEIKGTNWMVNVEMKIRKLKSDAIFLFSLLQHTIIQNRIHILSSTINSHSFLIAQTPTPSPIDFTDVQEEKRRYKKNNLFSWSSNYCVLPEPKVMGYHNPFWGLSFITSKICFLTVNFSPLPLMSFRKKN